MKISLVRRRYWIVIAYPPKLLCGQTAYSSENLTLAAKKKTQYNEFKFEFGIWNFIRFSMIIHIWLHKIPNMFP